MNKAGDDFLINMPREVLTDPLRPQYHFLPHANWMNDPNGLIQKDGLTHLFYQMNPNGAFHGTIHWGHAVSRDLVHWEDWPTALTPTPGGLDADGCWSGCAVDDDGVPTILYTGLEPQVQCLATSHDGLKTWQKHPTAIIYAPPTELNIFGRPEFRDPFVWREGSVWRMVVGTGIEGEGGAVLLYESDNLYAWRYLGVLHSGRFADSANVWECPNLFTLGGKHVLIVSEQPEFKYAYMQVGTVRERRFLPETTTKLDHGPYFYAALSMLDVSGRRLLWGWLKEGRTEPEQLRAGWSGVMSLPRQLSHDGEGLRLSPVPELERLRGRPDRVTDVILDCQEQYTTPVRRMPGNTYEVHAVVTLEKDAAFEIIVAADLNGSEKTSIGFDATTQVFTVNTLSSSLNPETIREQTNVFHEMSGTSLTLRMFVDRSIVETFLDGKNCITARMYPVNPEADAFWLECTRGSLRVVEMTVWPMKGIWD